MDQLNISSKQVLDLVDCGGDDMGWQTRIDDRLPGGGLAQASLAHYAQVGLVYGRLVHPGLLEGRLHRDGAQLSGL